MVKCFCIQIFDKNSGQMLAAEYDLASFSFFQRGSVQEAMNFMAKTTVERTSPGVRTKVEEAGFLGNVFVRNDGLGLILSILIRKSWRNCN
jgi:synaptobrevin family protein YKT6